MKDQEIANLKETVELYTPQSPPDVNVLFDIMEAPVLDLKESADDVHEFLDYTYSENPFLNLGEENRDASEFPSDQLAQYDQPASCYSSNQLDQCEFRHAQAKKEMCDKMDRLHQRRLAKQGPQTQPVSYTKKASVVVTDPKILYALRQLCGNVYKYSRNFFRGTDINGVRYAFYFGKVGSGDAIGLSTNIVLSSEKKVYNVSNMNAVVEMNWNQDPNSKGKRSFGHIYLGKLTGERGFEAYLKDPFMTELGVHI